jgi:hypothetical protein
MYKLVMIVLVGGRQAPNIIGVTSFRPDLVEFVVSNDEKDKFALLKEALASIPNVELAKSPYLVPAFNVDEVKTTCNRIIASHPDARFSLNLTCATKVMSIGAYEAARQAHPQKSISAFYLDTIGRNTITLVGDEMGRPNVPQHISQYLRAYGRSFKNKFSLEDLSCSQETAINIAKDWAVGKEYNYICANNADHEFVNGHWLEVYVFDAARNIKKSDGKGMFFSDVRMSIEIPAIDGAINELDVAALYHGQLFIISCKTGKNSLNVSNLDQISAVSGMIGGQYCSRIFVTNQSISPRRVGFISQAKNRQIVLVGKKELQKLDEILTREAIRPTYPRL